MLLLLLLLLLLLPLLPLLLLLLLLPVLLLRVLLLRCDRRRVPAFDEWRWRCQQQCGVRRAHM